MRTRLYDDVEEVIKCIQALDNKEKQTFLEEYKAYLAAHPEDSKKRSVYFAYMGLQSLADLAAAHLELDPNVTLRMTHSMGVLEESIDSRHIDDGTLAKRLPLYTARLFRSQGVLAFSNQRTVVTDNLIARDKIKLDQLILDIETVLQKWAPRKTSPLGNISSVSLTVLLSLIYLAIEIYLIYSAVALENQRAYYYAGEQVIGPNDPHPNTNHTECHYEDVTNMYRRMGRWRTRTVTLAVGYQHDYTMVNGTSQSLLKKLESCDVSSLDVPFVISAIVVGVFGLVGIFFSSLGFFACLWNREIPTTIPKNEWEPLVMALKEGVISKLADDSLDGLILKSKVNSLHNGMAKEKVISVFTDVVNGLKQIRADMDATRKPISKMPIVKRAPESSLDQSSSEMELEEVIVMRK